LEAIASLTPARETLDLILRILCGSGVVVYLPEQPDDRYQLVHDYLADFIRQQQASRLEALLLELEQERQHRLRAEMQAYQAQQDLASIKREQQQALPYAISLYKTGALEGERQVEGTSPVPFSAFWKVSTLPVDPVICTVIFTNEVNEEYKYEIELQSLQVVKHLIDVVLLDRETQIVDFSQAFYAELFRLKLDALDSN